MTHKLPELFQVIINHDKQRPGAYETVVPIGIIHQLREWRVRRNDLTAAAQRFIKKQRGSGGSGASG